MIYDHRKIVPAQPPTQPGQYSSSAAATSPGASTNGYSGGYAMGNGNGNGMSSMNPANGHRPAQLGMLTYDYKGTSTDDLQLLNSNQVHIIP
jgi:hypothetical protein